MLCDILKNQGYEPVHINSKEQSGTEERVSDYSVIIFPVPVSKNKINIFSDDADFRFSLKKAVDSIDKDSLVFGGGFPSEVKDYFESEGITYSDMLQSELFSLENAFFTAQGALRLLLESTDEYLLNKKVLLTGFGKISFALSDILNKIGMEVSVCARNELQLKYAENLGYEAIRLGEIENKIPKFDYIFNTVPYRIFGEEDIKNIKDRAKYFELASSPFGADKNFFEKLNKIYIFGGSLPGKYLPYSSAELIAKYILKYI